ncbi:MAG: DEAD/DEAH box helicase [Spirochaetaceae bacterium]|jgi:DEAD/DEAH box helicase domain-containing protein|nr:DEAD/DEAH box helicase [Spirochaetaceae bacterium]
MDKLSAIIKTFQEDINFISSVTRWEHIPSKPGIYTELPEDLNPIIRDSLLNKGISNLYSHQKLCYEMARSGKDFVVVTPTASGKTLCYNLPILQTLLEMEDSRALYLFPTKALSQDQQSSLNEIVLDGKLPIKICTYDGDTPGSLRISARKSGRIIISNPDMLHSGILPNHPKWIEFFKSLKYIVLDEVHTYRGVFGSHMTNLIRRLRRIAAFYGSYPVFICCSATIGNPKELADTILEKETVLVNENGAPSGEKHVILYNPPLVDPVQGIRRGIVLESQRIALKFLKQGIKTIIFARSRVKTELISSYLNKSLSNHYNQNFRIKVEPYRGGYLPGERRLIEKGLRDGSICGVVSTNALELGIDIGGLDVSILAGFPGSISSAWQQAGRAGRSTKLSLALIIASNSPVDQYLTQNPDYFFGSSPESGFVDPDNLYILIDHIKCAAFELPFRKGEIFGNDVTEMLDYLEENGVLRYTGESWYWADRSYPSERISLRGGAEDNVVIINKTKGKSEVIGEMDAHSARELIFEESIYIHKGDQYKVLKLDLENHICHVEESTVNYYTDSILKTDIKVLEVDEEIKQLGVNLISCDILVRSEVSKYKKIKFQTHENIGYGDIYLPESEMHTRSIVLSFEKNTLSRQAFELVPEELQAPVMARFATLVRNTAPIFLLCGRGDLGVVGRVRDPHFEIPGLYVYDNYPGGIGLADGFHIQMKKILLASLSLVEGCLCHEGCPSCVGPCDDRDEFSGNPKTACIIFLKEWLKDLL